MLNHNLSNQKISQLLAIHDVPVTKLVREGQTVLPVYFEGLTSDGKKHKDVVNEFNDIAILFDLKNSKIIGCWQCTTEAGRDYRIKHLNPEGFALIDWGYQEAWVIGRHKTKTANQYPTLVQLGGEVRVIRNKDSNGNRTTGFKRSGYFGINVHTVANKDNNITLDPGELRTVVGTWSAGCIVLNNAEKFYNEFMPLIMQNTRKVIGQLILPSDEYVKL